MCSSIRRQVPNPAQPSTEPTNETQTWALFLLLSVIWGSSFLFIKIALDEGVAPLTIVSYRTLFGGLLLALVLLIRGGRLPLKWDVWKRMTFLALTNIVIPFALIAWGQQYIPSGMAAILNALVPLFTIVLAAFILHDEAVTAARLAGLAIGFGGVVLLALPSLDAARGDADAAVAVVGMLAVALAAVSYGIAVVYSRRRLTGHAIIGQPDGTFRAPTPVEIALGSTLVAFIVITALAIIFERPAGGIYPMPQSSSGWIAVLWLGLLGTGLAYLLFFGILERWGATRTTLVTYIIPIVAIVLGFALLEERLRLIEVGGAVLIISGVVLVNAKVGQRPLFSRAAAEPRSDP
jgi:drug/metabolite transporter (DMT)-like permease